MQLSTPATRATPEPSLRWVLASLALGMLLPSLGTSIANVALPTLAQEFGAPQQRVQWVVLAYLLAITTLVVGAGRLGDLVGRRRLMLAGIAVLTLASALSAAAPTLELLISARALQGLGAAVMMALTMSLVADAVPKAGTGSAMGLLGTMSAAGTALGPTLGGALIAAFGWPSIFWVQVPLGLLALMLVHRHLPADVPPARPGRAGFDGVGAMLLAATLATCALAATLGHGSFGRANAVLLLGAFVGLGLFVVAERRAAAPMLRLALFRDPLLSAGFAASALVTTVVMATLVVGPFYLSGALQLDPARVGLVMSCGPIVAALVGVPAGRIVDRFGAQRMGTAGLIAMAIGAAILGLLPTRWGVPGYVAPLVVLTAGYALFQAANNTTVMTHLAPNERGVVSGVLTLARNLGLLAGASVMASLFAGASAVRAGIATHAEAVAAGMRATFGVAAVIILAALLITAASRRLARRRGGASSELVDAHD